MSTKRRADPSSGPSAKAQRQASPASPSESPGVEPMAVDDSPSVAASDGRVFPDDALSLMHSKAQKRLRGANLPDDDESAAFKKSLQDVYCAIMIALDKFDECPQLISLDQFVKNVKVDKKLEHGLSFIDSLRKALNGNDYTLWRPVVTHDVCHVEIPDDRGVPSDPSSGKSRVPNKYHQALVKSWDTPFIGKRALEALEQHVVGVTRSAMRYAPYCSIIQSSGMGKSRLLDEFSKNHFLIPINLRKRDAGGFPPPDHAIRDLLTGWTDKKNERTVMRHFLIVLFEKTKSILESDLTDANSRSERITKFREFMTTGQDIESAGQDRQYFYEGIADEVKTRMGNVEDANGDRVQSALRNLQVYLSTGRRTDSENKGIQHVFIAFDDAHTLPGVKNDELCWALHDVKVACFSFFVSTISKTSEFSESDIPRDVDSGNRIMFIRRGETSLFSDLGFDHLMQENKIFVKYNTIDDVTSVDCVVRMGRPLWGAMYSASAGKLNMLGFAQERLLCVDHISPGSLGYSSERGCAVLSQRLALDINSTGYVASGFTRKHEVVEKAQYQISNHMRICVTVPSDLVAVYGIAASEPILSEAASVIMREHATFDLSRSLHDVLNTYSISPGDRGELLVAAFFTRARDLHVMKSMSNPEFVADPAQLCPVFSVVDLLSNLFNEKVFHKTVLNALPSVYWMGIKTSQRFGDTFKNTKMHFNHVIKPTHPDVISRQYLLNIMARGAAALGANGQPGYDMVFPYIYNTIHLDIKKVGFIIVQVNNTKSVRRREDLFTKMDPFACNLFRKDTVPIIRLVFSLRTHISFERMQYVSTSGATKLKDGQPCFTSYDFWCSGMGPGILQPVDENGAQRRWEEMLDKCSISEGVFLESKDPDLRRSEHPGGGLDGGHYDRWLPESRIARNESESESGSECDEE